MIGSFFPQSGSPFAELDGAEDELDAGAAPEDAGMMVEAAPPKAAAGPKYGKIAQAVLATGPTAIGGIRRAAQDWSNLCQGKPVEAVREIMTASLELSGIPIELVDEDVTRDGPVIFLEHLPDRVREMGLDLSVYPLIHKTNQGRKAVAAWQRFWGAGISTLSAGDLMDKNLLQSICSWFIHMSQVSIRALRHVTTVAALSLAEALGQHCQALVRNRDLLEIQLANPASQNKRQVDKVTKDVQIARAQADAMYNARSQLLEGTVPPRCRDVCEGIRLHTLSEMERLIRQDPDLYLQPRWTARVFLMVHDPSADVRIKALNVIQSWYTSTSYSDAVQDYLHKFAQQCLALIVERTQDVDARVACAAVKVLRVPQLAERLDNNEFDSIANLCLGSSDLCVREEAALFVNSHVFQDPGICVVPKKKQKRDDDPEDEEEGEAKQDVYELYNSETAISMLMEFMESFFPNHLRITDRCVSAFWDKAPSLSNWSTMVNLCLMGESQRGPGLNPISAMQRLALLYVMEASIRKADEASRSSKTADKDAAVKKLNDACARVIPEMPRLMEVCQPEARHCLLLSHISKMLFEYAIDNSQNQVLVNPSTMCSALVKAINSQTSLDTVRYCVDALVALSRVFNEAKTAFLDLATGWHDKCVQLLKPKAVGPHADQLTTAMGRYVVLSNRALDMTFGSTDMVARIIDLLRDRSNWMWNTTEEATDGEKSRRPAAVPDAKLAMRLIGAASVTLMWYVRMVYWLEAEAEGGPDAISKVKEQIDELLQGKGDFDKIYKTLPLMCSQLRETLASVIAHDRCPQVQFHAFSSYMSFHQFAVGVSEKVDLEKGSREDISQGWGDTFEVRIPIEQLDSLWTYMNNLYQSLSEVTPGSFGSFDYTGCNLAPEDIFPAPATEYGNRTTASYMAQRTMEGLGAQDGSEEEPLSPDRLLLTAVLTSRMIAESEVEEIFAGPMGMLLLTQVHRSRPKPVREVALTYLKRMRTMARGAEAYAALYFRVQEKGIAAMHACSGLEAATKLCTALTWQWGPRGLPWLERPMYLVLKDAMLGCITKDQSNLPLLDVLGLWLKGPDFVSYAHCEDIADSLVLQCHSAGIDPETDPNIRKAIDRLRPQSIGMASMDEPAAEPGFAAEACVCGDVFMDDSLFCRKCGTKRPEQEFAFVEEQLVFAEDVLEVPVLEVPPSPAVTRRLKGKTSAIEAGALVAASPLPARSPAATSASSAKRQRRS